MRLVHHQAWAPMLVCHIFSPAAMSEDQARAVGRLAGRARHEDVVDLAVVEGALRRRDAIVSSDAEDILRVAAAIGERVRTEAV